MEIDTLLRRKLLEISPSPFPLTESSKHLKSLRKEYPLKEKCVDYPFHLVQPNREVHNYKYIIYKYVYVNVCMYVYVCVIIQCI